jgi:serine acetyltransferase
MRLGDNVMIGLGSVVMKSFSSNSYAVGNPARLTPKLNRFNKYNR